MKTEEILEVYSGREIVLFNNNDERIGKFKTSDIGLKEYKANKVYKIEPNDIDSIIVTVEES